MNTASAVFQSMMYRASQTSPIHQPHGDSFSFTPFVPFSGIDYWNVIAGISRSEGNNTKKT
uniref:Ovule protein n=1 Tax=Elaeophora elaphi TaxID=1147741 RepID=A0A0R3S1M6_9BILA